VPPTLAIGSDGTFYLSAPFDEVPVHAIPEDRRFFIGVAAKQHGHVGEALIEFLQRTEPRVLGLDGRVYIECEHVEAVRAVGTSAFYGYAATEEEAEQIQRLLGVIGMEVFSVLESRPKGSSAHRSARSRAI
jgi:hypothetical protein